MVVSLIYYRNRRLIWEVPGFHGQGKIMSEEEIDKKVLEKIAGLAAVDLSGDESEQLAKDLARIITYFDRLQEVDTREVKPTSHPMRIQCPLRKDSDTGAGSIRLEKAQDSFPLKDGEFFVVPEKQ